ncbi:hypothetical protein L1887_57648 [Cichorium endivia]|nr:hypothetical protein L1887_57648 [Cichorium endivia]
MAVHVVRGSVFDAPPAHAIFHCVATDLLMRRGFAVAVTERYGGREDLQQLNLGVGDVGVLPRTPHRDRLVLALVTKSVSSAVANPADFSRTLEKVPGACRDWKVAALSGPLLGAGRDGLSKKFVLAELQRVFEGTGISVTIWVPKFGMWRPADSVVGSTTLVGDSNFLRVLGAPPQTRRGYVQSGATLREVALMLRGPCVPQGRVCVLIGTNDLLGLSRRCKSEECGEEENGNRLYRNALSQEGISMERFPEVKRTDPDTERRADEEAPLSPAAPPTPPPPFSVSVKSCEVPGSAPLKYTVKRKNLTSDADIHT